MQLHIIILLLISSIYLSSPPEAYPKNNPAGLLLQVYQGKASYYNSRFHGRKTASGEKFNQEAYTAAHRVLPFGTIVRITNLSNGRQQLARINDRGPTKRSWIVDVSNAVAKKLNMIKSGVIPVQVEVVGTPSGYAAQNGTGFFVSLDDFSSKKNAQNRLEDFKKKLPKKKQNTIKVQNVRAKKYALTLGSYKTYSAALKIHNQLKDQFPQSTIVCLPLKSPPLPALAFPSNNAYKRE